MAINRYVYAHCSTCRGTGSVFTNERVDEEGYWCSFGDCHCVEYKIDPHTAEVLHKAIEAGAFKR